MLYAYRKLNLSFINKIPLKTFIKKVKIRPLMISSIIILFLTFHRCTEVLIDNSLEPKAGFCLTFDDDYIEDWYSINDMLLLNNVKATFFVSEIYNLSSDQIELLTELKTSGHEIGSHGWNHTNAVEYLNNHTLEEYYRYEIQPAIEYMEGIGLKPESFAYPFGRSSDSLDKFLFQYFNILRHVTVEQLQLSSKEVDEIDEIYYKFNGTRYAAGLGIDVNYKISQKMLKKVLIRAKTNDEVVVLFSHRPVDSSPQPYETNKTYLDSLLKLANELNLKSYRFSELLDYK